MEKKSIFRILATVFAGLFFYSSTSMARQFIVGEGQEFTTVQAAIDEFAKVAVAGDEIFIKSGEYEVNTRIDFFGSTVSTTPKLIIRGEETKTTILKSKIIDDTVPTPVFDFYQSSAEIRNLTFYNNLIAIRANTESAVDIYNNVFVFESAVPVIDTAILIDGNSLTTIKNNTFFNINTAINVINSDPMLIHNNLFYGVTAILIAQVDFKFSCISNSTIEIVANSETNITADPLFVDSSSLDFHLKQGSPCINAGNPLPDENDKIDNTTNDIGAYGGNFSDLRPATVSDVTVTKLDATSIKVTWTENLSYHVTNDNDPPGYGKYNIHYDQKSIPDYIQNPTSVDAPLTEATITGLTVPIDIDTPSITQLSPGDQRIEIEWSKINSADGYNIHYGTQSTADNTLDVGNKTSYAFENLENGVTYFFAVSAYLQPRYYVAVSVVDNQNNQSALSQEVSVDFGDLLTSSLSVEQSDFAESLQAYPVLPDEGCFVATAAFGYYSAPQVQILRDFRDRYLLTHTPGRIFVNWYYAKGPIAADIIRNSRILKEVTRWILAPLILLAYLTLNGLLWTLIPVLMIPIVVKLIRLKPQLRRVQNGL